MLKATQNTTVASSAWANKSSENIAFKNNALLYKCKVITKIHLTTKTGYVIDLGAVNVSQSFFLTS